MDDDTPRSEPDIDVSAPNAHVCAAITASISGTSASNMMVHDSPGRADLDSHANMVVLGNDCLVLRESGKSVDVNAFAPEYATLKKVPVVDAAILYESPYDGHLWFLIFKNALHVPTMSHHLIPPFVMREAGAVVNDTAKIHIKKPTTRDHAICFDLVELQIPLCLSGIFSYFPCRTPTLTELTNAEDGCILLATPDGPWDPHSDHYAQNEEHMLDFAGQMVPENQRQQRVVLDDIQQEEAMVSSATISAAEHVLVDDACCSHNDQVNTFDVDADNEAAGADCVSSQLDEVTANLLSVSPTLVPEVFAARLAAKRDIGHFGAHIGATDAWTNDVLFPEIEEEDLSKVAIENLDFDHLFEATVSSSFASKSKGVDPSHLAKVWRIDHATAKRTIDVTSQLRKRPTLDTLNRNYPTDDRMLRYKRIDDYFFMDTFFATKQANKSSRGNTCMQLFVSDKSFLYVVPMKSKSEVPAALKLFAKEVGAPDSIIADAAGEQTSRKVKTFLQQIGTSLRVLEKSTQWANRAELYIGLIKEAVRQDMKASAAPIPFWDYCAERRVRINNLVAKDLFQLKGRNPHYCTTGDEGDISNVCQYSFYQWVYYRDGDVAFPGPKEVLGRCLGPAKGEGNEMSQWVLRNNGRVIPRRTLRPLTEREIREEVKQREIFDVVIHKRFGSPFLPTRPIADYEVKDEFDDDDDDEPTRVIPEFTDPVDAVGRPIDQQPAYDTVLNTELMLPNGDSYKPAKVVRRTLGSDGLTHGSYHQQPELNTMTYDVEFDDGLVKEYTANVIADELYAQTDDEGFTTNHLDGIVDFRKLNDAVSWTDAYVQPKGGAKRLRKTTCGWQFLVRWKSNATEWIPLKDMKESYPVQTAEFATSRGIHTEPAFTWWVPYTLRKRDVIISAVKARVRKTSHKYGKEIPTSRDHAYEIDKKNGNTLWGDALKKEMMNVGVAFEILPVDGQPPPGWSKVSGHIIFDIKMDYTRKARWVLNGHLTPDATGVSTYAGVVSRESKRIALTYAALNNLDVIAADIRNAYLQAPSSRKDYIICGKEFGLENEGRVALIHRALYGGKTAGRDFRNHLRECMAFLGFKSCKADPDVWMRAATKHDGSPYWEYVLLYTDDALAISENAEKILREEIGRYFELKAESIGPPEIYLGGRLRKVVLDNGAKAWAFGSAQYVRASVNNVKEYLAKKGMEPLRGQKAPFMSKYRPEVDVTPELSNDEASYYQSIIGILRWIVELGRVDICCEVSLLSSHLALPRKGHLDAVFHILGYLDKHHNAEMVFDPSDPTIDMEIFNRKDWSTSESGLDLVEELPYNMPEARGFGFTMRAYVDADHATDSITRRSRTGFLVYLNSAPIYWTSKKQISVETSSFGSEFTAMKQCTEYVRGLRYKLRMMGIPCEGPTYVYGDNQSVLFNTTIPESTLKKKTQSIAYHFVREGAAKDEWRTAYVNTHLNPSDLLTKPLPAGEKRWLFVGMILHHVAPTNPPKD
jgi:hypothetical protein